MTCRRYYDVNTISVHYTSGKTAVLAKDIYTVEVLDGAVEVIGKSKPEVVNLISLSTVTTIGLRRDIDNTIKEVLHNEDMYD